MEGEAQGGPTARNGLQTWNVKKGNGRGGAGWANCKKRNARNGMQRMEMEWKVQGGPPTRNVM
eukprot:1158437-Pelagomonas_calceolata.AAC.9